MTYCGTLGYFPPGSCGLPNMANVDKPLLSSARPIFLLHFCHPWHGSPCSLRHFLYAPALFFPSDVLLNGCGCLSCLMYCVLLLSSLLPIVGRPNTCGECQVHVFSCCLEYPLAPQLPSLKDLRQCIRNTNSPWNVVRMIKKAANVSLTAGVWCSS